MKKGQSSAATLRSLLLVCVVLSAIAVIGGFYFAETWLSENASNSKTKNYQTVSGSLSSNDLIVLQNDVFSHQVDSIKAVGLISSKQHFANNARKDLNEYASKIGISITGFGSVKAPAVEASIPPISGAQSQYVSVTIANPIQFTKLFKFIQAIETNVPKLRLTGISIKSDTNKNGFVIVKPIIIGVYTK